MQTDNNITDQAHWDEYWKNYRFDKIPREVVFEKYMIKLTRGSSFIEIGGFPGIFAAYFYKRGIRDVSILDFHMNESIVRKLEKQNGLSQNTIQCIQADFFSFESEKKYDIVFSSGFIEHFQDTADVIRRHVNLMSKNGQLLILIPNFLGLNGKIQARYDKENLDSHNLKSMEINYLKEIMKPYGFYEFSVEYIGKPMVWLEPKPENNNYRGKVKTLSYFLKLFPVKGRLLSPFIAIYARK
ncbi:class I SAM-dependent methyltransferase [Petrimonas sp.]|uniref:class I SAM-dependent methyltransferase n=1 Tax=Petrimonas sp. TaxID=2023866 RepID=UPI003F512884